MPAVFIKGAIVVVSVVGAAAIAISQIPEVRAFGEDCRRKIAIALHNLGDEINPNRHQQPRFNRPEDAEGFMQPHAAGGEMDADEESRRRQREELMYWNAIKLENMQKAKEKQPKGPTFNNIPNNNSDEQTYGTKTGAEVLGDEGTLRRRGEGSRGMDRGSLYANPFADENYLDSEADAMMIAPGEDEMEDIQTDQDLREHEKFHASREKLQAIEEQHQTTTAEQKAIDEHLVSKTDFERIRAEAEDMKRQELNCQEIPVASTSQPDHRRPRHVLEDDQPQITPMEYQSKRVCLTRDAVYNSEDQAASASMQTGNRSGEDYQMQLILLQQSARRRLMLARLEEEQDAAKRAEAYRAASASTPGNHALQDYQMQLMLLEQQNKKRLMMARQEQDRVESDSPNPCRSTTPSPEQKGKLVDVAESSTSSAVPISAPVAFPGNAPQAYGSNDSFASIHAWNESSNASFYSPLPGTPKPAPSVAASEPEHLGGDITPTDSISLVGSGEDVANDNASSVGGGRYDDVMSIDGGISTPGSWTEVGSVVSEDDYHQ